MTLDEYVDCVQTAAVLFGQRFTRDDLTRAYDHADEWLYDLPRTVGPAAVHWLEAHHTGRLTLRDLHTALRARGSVVGHGPKVIVGKDGHPDPELTAEWETRNRNPDPRRRPGGTLDIQEHSG